MWLWKRKSKAEREGSNALDIPVTRKVLLLAGGSASSQAAAEFALQFSEQTGAKVTAVYVVNTDSLDFLQSRGIFVEDECREFGEDMEEMGGRYLERVRRHGEARGLQVETELIKGRFLQAVLGLIKERGADMLVMGGWASGIRSKDISGRLRQTVADSVDCPVVVVKG